MLGRLPPLTLMALATGLVYCVFGEKYQLPDFDDPSGGLPAGGGFGVVVKEGICLGVSALGQRSQAWPPCASARPLAPVSHASPSAQSQTGAGIP